MEQLNSELPISRWLASTKVKVASRDHQAFILQGDPYLAKKIADHRASQNYD